MKLMGNAAHGKTLTKKLKHVDVACVRGEGTPKLINNHLFKKMTDVTSEVFEVEILKQKILWDLPFHIGFLFYENAKLRMLEIYYDFLDKLIKREDFQLCEMDTDSLYLAMSSPTPEEVVKPKMLKELNQIYGEWFPHECYCHSADFIALSGKRCSGCVTCRQVQLLEYNGVGMISLCSNTYYCFVACKTCTKGVNKAENKLDKTIFLKFIEYEESQCGTNISLMILNNHVYSYEQHWQSLSLVFFCFFFSILNE